MSRLEMVILSVVIIVGDVALPHCHSGGVLATATPEQVVYGELVEAGCLFPMDGGAVAVGVEHTRVDQPGWLACLYDGGTVPACGVPCR